MPTHKDELKVAIVGAGRVANRAYLPLLRTWPGIRIVGLYSRTQDTVDEACREWEIDFGTTSLEALIRLEPNAAFVLTPRASHVGLTDPLLSAGIDVFLEKPPTESSFETEGLADLAQANKCVFMLGFNRRYALLYQDAKEIFEDRRIQSCVVEKHRPSAFHPSLYNNYLEDTIHQIDLLRYFCGEVEVLHTAFEAEGDRMLGATSVTRMDHGGLGIVHTSLQAGGWLEGVTLHGESMTVEVDAFREMRIRKGDRVEVIGPDRPGRWIPDLVERGFHGAIDHFFECVRERSTPLSDGFDALRTHKLVDALVVAAGEPLKIVPNPREDQS
jgi:virulence factor